MVPHTVFLSPLFGMADKTSVKLIVHQLSIDNFCLPFFFCPILSMIKLIHVRTFAETNTTSSMYGLQLQAFTS